MNFKFLTAALLILTSCGGKSNSKPKTPLPPVSEVVLVDYKPLKGLHMPLTHFLRHDNLKRVSKVYYLQELVDTSSWLSFKNSRLGKNLIGAMFKNNDPNKDLYLWFVLQLTPTEQVEYSLELTQQGLRYVGYETLKIGNEEETKLGVTFKKYESGDV